jgi:hypothetical protein
MHVAIPAAGLGCVLWRLPGDFIAAIFEWAAEDPADGATDRGKAGRQKIRLLGTLSNEGQKGREVTMVPGLTEAMKPKSKLVVRA